MNAYELAKKYYPQCWDINRLKTLVETNPQKLTVEQYKEITGHDYVTENK